MAGGKGGGLGGRGNKAGSPRKGAMQGSGGQRKKGLEGKGPTPKATERTKHPAAKRAAAAARRGQGAGGGPRGGGRPKVPYKANRQISELIAGRNSVLEALRAEIPATTLYVAAQIDIDDRVRESLTLATQRALPILEVSRQEVDRLTDGAIHQGVALQIPQYQYAHPDELVTAAHDAGESPLIVALDGVTDPRNLGAIVRSAAAFGAHGVVVPERRSAGMTAGAWKTSAGAAARIPVAQAGNLTRTLEAYQKQGLTVVGLAADGGVDLADLETGADPIVLVIGSEDKGMSRLVAQTCDLTVRVPIAAATESLNAGVAAAISLYGVAELRRKAGRL